MHSFVSPQSYMNQIVDLEKKVSEAEHALLRSKYEMGVAHQAEMDRIKTTVRMSAFLFACFLCAFGCFFAGEKKSFVAQFDLPAVIFIRLFFLLSVWHEGRNRIV
jgi:hypothetical protein